ncbi:uncharacterized protein LOC113295630 [Papaver somniferum]|uniref:uncharacterized protein LOC113295630 n=1 Tax=Papaver somniferum TaxID=3469 RepID=UPI000E705405|nr:uncharacterized protein LOC113295630 [Papaver somniferum]
MVYDNLPSLSNGPDRRVRMPDLKWRFSVSSAREIVRTKYPTMDGAKVIWRGDVHPSLAAQNWKFIRGACATLNKVRSRFKIQLPNRCCVCKNTEESLDHVLWSCELAVRIWNWVSSIFALKPDANPIISYKAASGKSQMVKDLWLVANLVIRAELWKVKHAKPIACFWSPPDSTELLICCDGASQGNPGSVGAGVIARDANCGVVGAMSVGLGFVSNYLAELYAILLGLEWDVQWGYSKILVRTDSASVVRDLEDFSLPWFAQQRWMAVRSSRDVQAARHIVDPETLNIKFPTEGSNDSSILIGFSSIRLS